MIGNIIKDERIKQNMKQNVLAKGICSSSYLCKIENNQVEPSYEILKLLFNRLSINLEFINSERSESNEKELFFIYEEVIKTRNKILLEEKLNYLKSNRTKYITKEIYLTFKIVKLYILAVLNTDKTEIELIIKNLEKINLSKEQSYLFEKCQGIYYYNTKDFKNAKKTFKKALHTSRMLQVKDYEKADLEYMCALTDLANLDYLQSIENIKFPSKYFFENIDFQRLIECLLVEGISNQKLKNFTKSYEVFLKALKLAENEKNIIPLIYQNLGSVSSSLGNLEESLDYYLKSYHLKEIPEKKLISIFSIIQIYSKKKNYTLMENWINTGLYLCKDLKSVETYYYHFKMYEFLFIYSNDLKNVEEAFNHFEKIQDSRHIFKYGIKVAEKLKEEFKYKKATHYYEKAIFHNNQGVLWEDL